MDAISNQFQHKMMLLHTIKSEKQCYGSTQHPWTLDAKIIPIKTRLGNTFINVQI